MSYTIWASAAAAIDKAAPSEDEQAAGWASGAYPPHQTVNWYMNRTDTRLTELETPWLYTEQTSLGGSRTNTLLANSTYTVPTYTVGDRGLHVYLDGILCTNGETYSENGSTGTDSTTITWLVDIDKKYTILCESPTRSQIPASSS